MYKITVFQSQTTKGKSPISPFNDNSFIFQTQEVETEYELFCVMANNYILNIPLNNAEPIRSLRRKANLSNYYDKIVNYFVLDIDHIYSEEAKSKILQYFKQYKCIIGESRNYNGIDNFNLKGFIFVDLPLEYLKFAVSKIHNELDQYGDVDEAVGRRASLNAPMNKVHILMNNSKCENIFKLQDIDVTTQKAIVNANKLITKLDLDLSNVQGDTIEKICLQVFQNMQFTALRTNDDGSITFSHPSEVKTPGGYFWYSSSPYIMHHFNVSKNINIFEDVRKLPQTKELLQKQFNYSDRLVKQNKYAEILNVNQQYLEITPEINDSITKFLERNDGLYIIRSPMGTGKSTVISHIINECGSQDMRVLIITNRISVAQDFKKKYGMKLYNKDKYQIGDSLICQYDSLWKYNIKYFDVVILDEFVSLLLHSRSSINNSAFNCGRFFASFNKKLVIADAFLTGYENNLLTCKKENVFLLNNEYRDPTEIYNYSDYNYFIQTMLRYAEHNKITVSSTSLKIIDALHLLFTHHNLKVVKLTAETPQNTKELIYSYFDKEDNDTWDVLLYSPTLTVGVSNLNNIKYHFHYDSAITTDVVGSLQMVKRTRKAKEIHLFIKNRLNFAKTSFDEIRDDYLNNIGSDINNNYLFEMNDYGEPKLSKLGKKCIQIDVFRNILEFNHKSAFLFLMKYHFLNEPKEINYSFESNILLKYQKESSKNKELLLKENLNQFLLLNNIKENFEISDDTQKALNVLSEIDENILVGCDLEIKRKIIELAIEDKNFIQRCKYYKLFVELSSGLMSMKDIRLIISKCIMINHTDDLKYLSAFVDYTDLKYSDTFSKSELSNDHILAFIVKSCGYKIYNDNIEKIGERYYEPDRNVKKYYNHIKGLGA